MTAPSTVIEKCVCGHGSQRHAPVGVRMCMAECECMRYTVNLTTAATGSTAAPRPPAPAAQPVPPQRPPAPPSAPSLNDIVAAGKRSRHQRTVALAEKVEALAIDLRGRLAVERRQSEVDRRAIEEAAKAKQEVDRISAELTAARKALAAATKRVKARAAQGGTS